MISNWNDFQVTQNDDQTSGQIVADLNFKFNYSNRNLLDKSFGQVGEERFDFSISFQRSIQLA